MYHTHLNCYVLVLVTLFLLYMSPSPSADVRCKHLSLSRALITLNSFTRPKHANHRGKSRRGGEIVSFFRKKGVKSVQIVNPAFFYNQSCTFGMRWWFKVFEQLFSCYTNINFLFASMKLLTNFEIPFIVNCQCSPASFLYWLRWKCVKIYLSQPHRRISVWFYRITGRLPVCIFCVKIAVAGLWKGLRKRFPKLTSNFIEASKYFDFVFSFTT